MSCIGVTPCTRHFIETGNPMKIIRIVNINRPEAEPIRAGYAVSFWSRLRGLTFRGDLPLGEGLLLVESKESRMDTSIHMLMVFMDLGVVWINNDYQVVDTVLARSWRPAYFPKQPARYVLEINPQRLKNYTIGDRVQFDEDSV
jgi:uncharacterized membrane protein (UPF0127 family)